MKLNMREKALLNLESGSARPLYGLDESIWRLLTSKAVFCVVKEEIVSMS